MKTERNSKKEEKLFAKKKKITVTLTKNALISLAITIVCYFLTKDMATSISIFLTAIILLQTYFFVKETLKQYNKIKKMESVFPDFIELMASNLRAGMTIDRALLLSSRKEFSPLDEEILILGKDIITGKEMSQALINMAKRIKSEKILKTIIVINSGIKSGGNLAILLEETAINIREREFVEKRSASNVLMYLIFIFFAIAVGAPFLFGLSSVLVQVLSKILVGIPNVETKTNLPVILTSVNISTEFITNFSIIFLIIIDVLASLLLGLVNKGEEKTGLKYVIPLIIVSITIFFSTKAFLLKYFSNFIG